MRVSIALDNFRVTLPGIVVEVINTETSVDGSTSFRVEIRNADQASIERLTAILRHARAGGLELSPPPPRKSRRFSVTWPIAVLGDGHQFNAAATDISQQGLFLATTNLIRARKVVFGIPLDTQDSTVRGRARIAREVSEEMAQERKLCRGYGLHIEGLSAHDLQRYEDFVVRVRERSQLHVLVASQSRQGAALAHSFQSAGYTVSQATSISKLDPDVVLDKGRPNVAVLDEGDLDTRLRTHVESSLEAHGIPMLHLHGQSPTSARHALDQLMSV